jgi:hypothetical protein
VLCVPLVFFNFDGNASVINHIGICESAGATTGYKSFVTREELAVVEARALKL